MNFTNRLLYNVSAPVAYYIGALLHTARYRRTKKMRQLLSSDECSVEAQEKKALKKFLRNHFIKVFSYPFMAKYDSMAKYDIFRTITFMDKQTGLPYVITPEKRRLYFKRGMSKSQVRRDYIFLLAEQDGESPHCYTFDGVPADNTVIADVGAAEGNFSLQFIEKFKTVYLFEYEEEWVEALQATFAPWKDKVHIINTLVSDREADGQISLDSYFKDKEKPTLLKMDVEGYEEQILKGADALINNTAGNNGDPKPELLVCTYHRKDDAVKLPSLLREKGFSVKLSAKYMFFQNEFRKGLLHATPVVVPAKING